MNEEKNKKIFLIILVIAVLCLGIYKLFFEGKKIKEESIDTETISIVTNPNDFYTVSSCVSKYLSYLSIGDTEKIFILLSDEYKKNNEVTKDNLYIFLNQLSGVYNFNPKKMFVQQINKNVYKFYVYGVISEEMMDLASDETDFYIVVILDRENTTFSIEPYDGNVF